MHDSKQLERIDKLCRELGIRGNMRKLLILFAENGQATKEEIIEHLYADDPDGGPDDAEGTVRTMISRLRDRLAGKAEIPAKTVYALVLRKR